MKPNFFPNFSHIYVEKNSLNHPVTQEILHTFSQASHIVISHYKNLFNRPLQHQFFQERSKKLILAHKRPPFIYPGSELIQDFGFEEYLYTPTMQNCIFDCDYCLLKGMYATGNLVYFVNHEDFFDSVQQLDAGPKHLSISYDTDLLGFESIYPTVEKWIRFIANHPHIQMEVRTKSARFALLEHLSPVDNVILSWTLTPQTTIDRYESSTASLTNRIRALNEALVQGWKVRICIDPLIWYGENTESTMQEFMVILASEVPLESLHDVAIGVMRMNGGQLKNIRKSGSRSPLVHYPFQTSAGVSSYDAEKKQQLIEWATRPLRERIDSEKLFIVN